MRSVPPGQREATNVHDVPAETAGAWFGGFLCIQLIVRTLHPAIIISLFPWKMLMVV